MWSWSAREKARVGLVVGPRGNAVLRHQFGQPDKRPQSDPARAFGKMTGVFFGRGRSGDIEMYPGPVLDELFDEHRAEDRAGRAATAVLHVCDRAADEIGVLGVQRQLPIPFV